MPSFRVLLGLAVAAGSLFAQSDYEGSDIRTAFPLEFGQVAHENLDPTLRRRIVYSISLARGQRFKVTVKETGNAALWVGIYSPSMTSIANDPAALARDGWTNDVATVEYAVPTAGTYFIGIWSSNGASEIETVATAVGARLDVPLPAVASCLEGNVDEIQYNMQQVSMNLAEEVTVGGVKICASCSVKPTLFPAFNDFLKQAHFAGTRVQVCHAADGQIVRVKSAR
jgi:hypothetical protein